MLKSRCFWAVVLEKTLENPLDCKEIKSVNPKGDQSWIFIGRTDAEAEAPILWPPDAKSQLTRKGPDAGKDWRQEEKGIIEDEMVGWHHWYNVHEFEQALGHGEGQGSLACCSPRGCKTSDMTEQQQIPCIHFEQQQIPCIHLRNIYWVSPLRSRTIGYIFKAEPSALYTRCSTVEVLEQRWFCPPGASVNVWGALILSSGSGICYWYLVDGNQGGC